MKKLALMLLLLPTLSFGQWFNVGITGGVPLYGKMNIQPLIPASYGIKPTIYSSLDISVKIKKKYELRFRSDATRVETKYIDKYKNALLFAEEMGGDMLMANYYYKQPVGEVYFGVCAGLVSYYNHDSSFMNRIYPNKEILAVSGNGKKFGVQVGYQYPLSRRFDLSGELGIQHYTVNTTRRYYTQIKDYKYNYTMYPIIVGIRFNFGGMKQKKKETDSSANGEPVKGQK